MGTQHCQFRRPVTSKWSVPNSASKHSVVQHSVVQLEDYSRERIFCGDVHGRDFNGVEGIWDK